ncbi:hypothetical protein Vadar_024258 [Vaccinium darrowii]|uniref:Uncharacterized protein n=1 Tax=Vaccinium darrowii TaxID=229202 RepID=A0ACB7YGW4_9ERIC|nr:hypothetical protein Vadar_024258 [Vaccinium darrowii]
MEMEPTPPMIAKKLWNTIRILFYMMRKGISKSKLMMFDLQLLLKQGKIAGKALTKYLTLHHQYAAALSCRSDDASLSFVSPREYEFSCSNSPAYPSYYSRRKRHHYRGGSYYYRREDDVSVIQKVFEILNNEIPEASPLYLPGFGKSPAVRQLRITDSPFPLKEAEEDRDVGQVDKAAEEFIKKFYKELKHQKKMASPSPYHLRAS